MSAGSLDVALGRLAVLAILAYQRYLSPLKGFRCAHRARHGGESCSEFARRTFAADGVLAGLLALGPRFRACAQASRALRAERLLRRVGDAELDASPGKAQAAPGPCSLAPTRDDVAHCAGECCCDLGLYTFCGWP